LRFVLGLIIAYVFLTLPLVLLTIFKTNKKANVVGTNAVENELAYLLKIVKRTSGKVRKT
ncbi:hypothetical protein ACI3SI_20085, partial [Lactococcus lactis]